MLKKQIITTEEFNSAGELIRRIVEENEFVEDAPMPWQMPFTPGGAAPDKPWWQDATCTATSRTPLDAVTTLNKSEENLNGEN